MHGQMLSSGIPVRLRIHSEQALLLDLTALAPQGPGPELMQVMQNLRIQLPLLLGAALLELVPSYTSVLVIFDVLKTDHTEIWQKIVSAQAMLFRPERQASSNKVIELPCYYSAESGPDLEAVAALHQLSINELIQLHSSQAYQVYAIGFAPGFAYLGFTDPRINTPRLANPRPAVAAGSVAIADRQTAVYPAASPGGWHLLGNCPIPLFDLTAVPMLPFAVGDTVRFVPIERAEFLRLGGQL
ncbi:5-oxoprolinase subunit PxpB [Rheinheimera sp. F8]|uniref:5-oxoprolinase subunit PxpB n=1 Tax=Rheinheimera sp. F8 TaxID=1763998 RepID=UPI000B237200|nr:5-oxoprolinase subunit PxpB [Rheinheimera sp. F8]